MTKPNSSLIAVVMDRSGSMGPIRDATIQGFNEFLKQQKEQPGECSIYYTHFDHEYEIVHNYKPIAEMPELTHETYLPRGNTALLDAIGKTIVQVGKDLADKKEEERPSNIIFVIQTDGMENASTEYSRQRIFELISQQRDTWNWNFLFLGASQESIQEAMALGMNKDQTLQYSHSPHGSSVAFAAASGSVAETRVTGKASQFTDKQRKEASKT